MVVVLVVGAAVVRAEGGRGSPPTTYNRQGPSLDTDKKRTHKFSREDVEVVHMEQAKRLLWLPLSLEERADIAEKYGADDLHICPDPWAVRHSWVNRETGEEQRARCNRWECLYCGPRKVVLWRQLVGQADPVLFLTLTKAGKTVEEAARALTTFVQALRRGSKGKGPNRVGARVAYPVEYFAVLERHHDFERNGFHWHLLIKGVEAIPYKEVIQPLWMSATHYSEETGEGAKIGHIERIRNAKAIGYVTKYLTKAVSLGEAGTRQVKRDRTAIVQDERGEVRIGRETVMETVASKAHRIRYSRHFFPEKVSALRIRLFAGIDGSEEGASEAGQAQDGKPLESEEGRGCSTWILVDRHEGMRQEVEDYKQKRFIEVFSDLQEEYRTDKQGYEQKKRAALAVIVGEARELARAEYKRCKRAALLRALEEDRPLSRRIINIWHYQRQQARLVG